MADEITRGHSAYSTHDGVEPSYRAASGQLSAKEYELYMGALRKAYDSLDTPEHHLAYVRERLAAARAEP